MKTVALLSPAFPSIGLEYLSAVLKNQGFRVVGYWTPHAFNPDAAGLNRWTAAIHRFQSKRIGQWIDAVQPDIIGITSTTYSYRQALSYLPVFRAKSSAPIVFGGIHASLLPQKVLAETGASYLFAGEGETIFPELCSWILEKTSAPELPNVYRLVDGKLQGEPGECHIHNLDALPFPDKSLFGFHGGVYPCISSRGCPVGSCSFCLPRNIVQPHRIRSAENIVEELVEAKGKYALRAVNFFDSIFTANKKHTLSLLALYGKKIRLPYVCASHFSFFDDELARTLKETGCSRISFGLQTWDEETSKDVLHRRLNPDRVMQVLESCRKVALPVYFDHILNLPTAPHEDIGKTLESYFPLRKKGLRLINPFPLWYYPCTQITRQAAESGYLSAEAVERIERGIETRSTYLVPPPKGLSLPQVRKQVILIWATAFLSPSLIRRLIRLPARRFGQFATGLTLLIWSFVRAIEKDPFFFFRLHQLRDEIRAWVRIVFRTKGFERTAVNKPTGKKEAP